LFPTFSYAAASPEDDNDEQENIPTYTVTGTLPVLYINTEDATPVTSKETYISGTYYLDPMGHDDVKALGSVDEPLPLEIRGRGNSTWKLVKKPYKIKLGAKTALMGLAKSKHFALLANGQNTDAFFNPIGFDLSKKLGFPWTPSLAPVELVLNGEFLGLYCLTENVRVEKNRVNINEQEDLNTDETTVNGGWLVELDNYTDASQIVVAEQEDKPMKITYHTPEVLSDVQKNWLINEFNKINAAIYNPDKNSHEWEDYIDIDMLARFVVVQEVMSNYDAYVGSWYLNKDLGEDEKWMCGPVWDLLWNYDKTKTNDDYVWNTRESRITKWLPELWKYPALQKKVVEIWSSLDDGVFSEIYANSKALLAQIADSYNYDSVMWTKLGLHTGSVNAKSLQIYVQGIIEDNVKWLNDKWNDTAISFNDIFASCDENGAITIDGFAHDKYTFATNSTVDVKFAPNEGYRLSSASLDGNDIISELVNNTYTIQSIDDDHTFTASFEIDPNYTSESSIIYNEASVNVAGRNVLISNVADDALVSIYNMYGTTLYQGYERSIALAPGIYILTVNNKAYKFVIK
jgi:hypothetical protein